MKDYSYECIELNSTFENLIFNLINLFTIWVE